MKNYSIIIPSKNITNLAACLTALRTHGERGHVMVIDDGLPTNPWRPLEGLGPVTLCAGRSPFIFARNCNQGIRETGTDDVVLLNDDCLLKTPYGFSLLQIQHVAAQEYGAICPGFIPEGVGAPDLVWRNRKRLVEVKPMLVFACVFIPRSTIDRVGLLDERFGVNAGGPGKRGYGLEDDDYSLRIRNAGLKLGVFDGVVVDHTGGRTGLKSSFRHDPEHPHDVKAHEDLFRQIHGQWPEGHGFVPGRNKL